jgi:hypothetical protein
LKITVPSRTRIKGGKKMGAKAYFMIDMDKKFCEDSCYLDAIRELEAIPEVEIVSPVSGACDLLVKVDAPIRVILVADKIRTKKWVKDFHILNIEPAVPAEAPELAEREFAEA